MCSVPRGCGKGGVPTQGTIEAWRESCYTTTTTTTTLNYTTPTYTTLQPPHHTCYTTKHPSATHPPYLHYITLHPHTPHCSFPIIREYSTHLQPTTTTIPTLHPPTLHAITLYRYYTYKIDASLTVRCSTHHNYAAAFSFPTVFSLLFHTFQFYFL